MLPLALIICIQLFSLGKTYASQTTFPLTSFSSYIYLLTICGILLFTQALMRSMTFSVVAGIALIAGIFSGWFGDFMYPLTSNLRELVDIAKASWMRKDIPFGLLTAGTMTFILIT